MERILIVEDDVVISGGLQVYLEKKGYVVQTVTTLQAAKQALQTPYALLLLDLNLPDGDGVVLCQEIRKTQNIPIIFLTARDTEEDMISGFQSGCDDYIAKPFSVELLYQHIKAVLRRTSAGDVPDVFTDGVLTVHFSKRSITLRDVPIKLSATEYKLLELLIRNRGQVLTRNQILEKIWDCDENYIDENTLNVHIRRLRQKIEPDAKHPTYIVTVFGIGYTFGEMA